MKNLSSWLLFVALGFVSSTALAFAGQIKVVANSSVPSDTISAEDLKRIFLEERTFLPDGTHVEPVLEKRGPIHEDFLQTYLGRTDDDLQTYYRVLVFTGRGSMPKALASDADVVAYVSRTRGAIGYVSAEAATAGVKVLAVASGNSSPRILITRIEPDYPETLKQRDIGGTVRLRVTISAQGNVEHVELLGGNPILADAAIVAVKQWVYAAGRSSSVAEVTVPFEPHR